MQLERAAFPVACLVRLDRPVREIDVELVEQLAAADRIEEILPRDGVARVGRERLGGSVQRELVHAHREGVVQREVSGADANLVQLRV